MKVKRRFTFCGIYSIIPNEKEVCRVTAPVFAVSVGSLAEFCFPQGSLGALPTLERMQEGTKAHKHLQNLYAADESIRYQREVPLTHTESYTDFTLLVQGRADGIITDGSGVCLHEIKSTYTPAASIEKPLKDAHKAQGMIYACFYAAQNGLNTIRLRLTYICLPHHETVYLEYTFSLASLETFWQDVLSAYASLIRRRLKDTQALKETSAALAFPFASFRKGQREGAAQVYTAIKKGKNLFLQAPTGAGKTLMTLFPAIKCIGEEPAKLLCLSAKTQTRAVTRRTLEQLRAQGLKIKTCEISAKAKVCLQEVQDCVPEACPYSLDFFKKLHDALPAILEEDDFSSLRIRELAEKYEICPYELSLALSDESHVILADYNYFFDPVVYLRRLFESDETVIVLADEAHNLAERCLDMYSAFLSASDVRAARKTLDKNSKLYRALGRLTTDLNAVLKTENITADGCRNTVERIYRILDTAQEPGKTPPPEVSLYLRELARFALLMSKYRAEDFSLHISGKSTLVLQCLDASAFVQESLSRSHAAVFYSATLTPYEFYKNSLLPDTEAFGFATAYPFDPENLTVYVDYEVDTRYTQRDRFYAQIARKLESCRQKTSGRIVVFFPSYAFMRSVAAEMTLPAATQENDSDTLLETLTADENAFVFAVMGSRYSEGLDLPPLAGIVIVGVALPQYNDERQRIRDHFEKKFGKGFEYAYVYPGIRKVCQAAGRLIRGEHDHGFLLLMDQRFRQYRDLLPAYWHYRSTESITPPPKQ